MDSASHIDGDARPTPDDVTMCLYCGAWLGFTTELTLRTLGQAEIETLPRETFDLLVRAGHARAEVMRNHPRAR